jgi:hypothetical protein
LNERRTRLVPELGLVGEQQVGRLIELPVRALPGQEGDLDAGDPVAAELDVADSLAVVRRALVDRDPAVDAHS